MKSAVLMTSLVPLALVLLWQDLTHCAVQQRRSVTSSLAFKPRPRRSSYTQREKEANQLRLSSYLDRLSSSLSKKITCRNRTDSNETTTPATIVEKRLVGEAALYQSCPVDLPGEVDKTNDYNISLVFDLQKATFFLAYPVTEAELRLFKILQKNYYPDLDGVRVFTIYVLREEPQSSALADFDSMVLASAKVREDAWGWQFLDVSLAFEPRLSKIRMKVLIHDEQGNPVPWMKHIMVNLCNRYVSPMNAVVKSMLSRPEHGDKQLHYTNYLPAVELKSHVAAGEARAALLPYCDMVRDGDMPSIGTVEIDYNEDYYNNEYFDGEFYNSD